MLVKGAGLEPLLDRIDLRYSILDSPVAPLGVARQESRWFNPIFRNILDRKPQAGILLLGFNVFGHHVQ